MSRYRAPSEEDLPRPELPDVWEGPMPEERGYLPSHLADIYEGPDVEAEAKHVPQPPAEAGAAMAEISDAVRRSQESDDDESGKEPEADDESRLIRIERDDKARDELSRPDVTLIHHVVVPGATIAMVGSLLFFLLDLRSAFVGGSFSLKWMGLCFVVATVLIARYVRLVGQSDSATLYSSALAVVTFVAMAMSPWEPPQTEIWGPLLNGVILYVTWRFASRLMHDLSADLDDTRRRRRRLFGLERQALESWRRQQDAAGKANYGLRDLLRTRRVTSDSEAALRSIARLTLLGLLVFALGEPILRLAEPGLPGKALGAMVAFLLSAGVLLGAASVAAQQRRLQRLHASAPWTLVTGRVVSALAMTVLALAMVLQVPAVHVEGSGQIRPERADGRSGELGDEPGDEPGDEFGENRPDGPADRSEAGDGSESDDGSESGGDTSNPSSSTSSTSSTPFGLVSALAAVGSFLRWPLVALVVIAIVVAAVRWIARQDRLGAALAALVRDAFGRLGASVVSLWSRLGALAFWRRKHGRDARRRRGDPFAAMAQLRSLDPEPAVVGAYAVLQAALADLGHERSTDSTPLEYYRTIPGVLGRLRPAADRLTRLYLLAAYAPTRLDDAQRRQAFEALEDLRAEIRRE